MNVTKIEALRVCFFSLCLGTQACSRNADRAPSPTSEEREKSRKSSAGQNAAGVAVLGSSTAAGFGLTDAAASWVERYAAHLKVVRPGVTVRDFAVPGFTTFQVLPTGSAHRWGTPRIDPAHNVTAALDEHPRVIIVNLPSNDAALGFTLEETMTNLHAVVAKAAEAGVPTWVTTSQPRTLDARGVALLERMRDAVLRDFKDRGLDFFAPLAAADGKPLPAYNQGDGIHPNAEGHRLLFQVVEAADIPRHFPTLRRDL